MSIALFRNHSGIHRCAKFAAGLLLTALFTYSLADSTAAEYESESLKQKEYDRLAVKKSDNPSSYWEIDGHKLGAGFIISRELKYTRDINSREAVRDYKLYSGMTWYSLLILAGGCAAMTAMMSYDLKSEFPEDAPNFNVPLRVCGAIVATVPLSLTLRIYFRQKAIARYNADLKSYLRMK